MASGNQQHPRPSNKPYTPPTQHSRVVNHLLLRHQVREIERAIQLYRLSGEAPERAHECADLCASIVAMQPSEAIRAKAHMMLAQIGDGHRYRADKT